MRPGIRARIAAAVVAACVVPLALASCATQADWDGSKRLASEECRLAAQLFAGAADPLDEVSDGAGGSSPLTRTELASKLSAHVPEDLREALFLYALPRPEPTGGESEAQQLEALEVLHAQSAAEDALRGWAQLSCGVEVADGAGELPPLDQTQSFESEVDGVRVVTIAGATEPDHAVQLCEEARSQEPEAQIEVTDLEGFPLALAEAGASCGYHPVLLEGLDGIGGLAEAGE